MTEHPETVNRFLASLVQAEEYHSRNSPEAKTIVRKRLNYAEAYMEAVWPQNQFAISLDQSLITVMEDEARWMIKTNLTTEKQVPDFLDFVYEDALKAVKPGAVNIIRWTALSPLFYVFIKARPQRKLQVEIPVAWTS